MNVMIGDFDSNSVVGQTFVDRQLLDTRIGPDRSSPADLQNATGQLLIRLDCPVEFSSKSILMANASMFGQLPRPLELFTCGMCEVFFTQLTVLANK